jgi:inosose dehydratase
MNYGYVTSAWGGLTSEPTGQANIKDLLYPAMGSTTKAIHDIAQAGYRGIEIPDGSLREFERSKQVFRHLMLEHRLELVAVSCRANLTYPKILKDELWWIDRSATLAVEMGASHFVIVGGAKPMIGLTDHELQDLSESLDRVADIAEGYGLTVSYLPHSSMTKDTLEVILKRSRINFCPNTAHLVAGSHDPAALIHDHRDRIRYVHLKGFDTNLFNFSNLSEGTLDNAAIVRLLEGNGYRGWVMVEANGCDGNPRDNAISSLKYLRALGTVAD